MRTAFLETLLEAAEADERVWLLVGDLGYSVVEPFRERFPDRFVNVGVAEQNMAGVAAGLALSGNVVFTYSIGNFPTLRCLEQIRNDICYHEANVKIVTVGGGLAYGPAGVTHHATEDLSIMRALPNMTVLAPGDPLETRLATLAVVSHNGPCYLRLGKASEPLVHASMSGFALGKGLMVRQGEDISLISAGGILHNTVLAADVLATRGVAARVISCHTVKPVDREIVIQAANETQAIMTVEEHSLIGGLGSAVAEVLAESGERHVPFRRLGILDRFFQYAGNQEFLRTSAGLSVEAIVAAAIDLISCFNRKDPHRS